MSRYRISVEVQMEESDEAVDTNPVEQADGSFRWVILDETASRIDDCEQALLRTHYAAVRQAISAHRSAVSPKKAQERADPEGGEVRPHDPPYPVDGEVGRFTFTTHGVQQGTSLCHRTMGC